MKKLNTFSSLATISDVVHLSYNHLNVMSIFQKKMIVGINNFFAKNQIF